MPIITGQLRQIGDVPSLGADDLSVVALKVYADLKIEAASAIITAQVAADAALAANLAAEVAAQAAIVAAQVAEAAAALAQVAADAAQVSANAALASQLAAQVSANAAEVAAAAAIVAQQAAEIAETIAAAIEGIPDASTVERGMMAPAQVTKLDSLQVEPVSTSVVGLAAGTRQLVVFTTATEPAGAGRFILTRAILRLSASLVGTGTATVSVVTGSGETQILLLAPRGMNQSTPIGVLAGMTVASLGAGMLATQAYEAVLPAEQNIWLNVSIVGSVTAGEVALYLYGLGLE